MLTNYLVDGEFIIEDKPYRKFQFNKCDLIQLYIYQLQNTTLIMSSFVFREYMVYVPVCYFNYFCAGILEELDIDFLSETQFRTKVENNKKCCVAMKSEQITENDLIALLQQVNCTAVKDNGTS